MSVLIDNATVVTMNSDREILYNHSVLIEDNKIKSIEPSDGFQVRNDALIISGKDKIIFPGLINTHNHLFQTLLKGLGDDKKLDRWFAEMTAPASVNLTEETVHYGAMLGCVEAIHSGTTFMCDYMYPHPVENLSDQVISALKKTGMRGILGRGMMDTGEEFGVPEGIIQSRKEILDDIERLLLKYQDDDMIDIWGAPAAAWSNTKDTLQEVKKITNKYKTGFSIHISETPFDREASLKSHGYTDAELLYELDIIGPEVLIVHAVHLNEKDIRMAQFYDLKVSHNPASNMYLASGVAPIPELIEKGVIVGLATDGAASNNSQNMIEALKLSALLQKVTHEDPTVFTAEKALEIATIDGAKAIGKDNEIGSIEPGKKADLFIYNPNLSPTSIPMHHPVSTLVYSGNERCVESVMINGEFVLLNGEMVNLNESNIIREATSQADKLLKSCGIDPQERKWRSLAFN